MKSVHLIKRAIGSLSQAPPSAVEVTKVQDVLNEVEFRLWSEMQYRDQRHSIAVLVRFDRFAPTALQSERAAALLHDVGKNVSGLGFIARVVATLVGPRGHRFANYHNHETLGAELLSVISDPRTVELVRGVANDEVSRLLRAADDI
ncbi:MAG: hypothetical protein NWQ72_02800 [Ilumatobacteraceae bacterium]|jgi:hypothetical protein|nr:hypothetical protein [Ilumatobacteraceae bacterium]MDP5068556.1 hypothetical protein [Ilumatobacteraceae bacterium]